ncbi:hypothetical protein MUY27_00200 [Mucilaginibacter sp. RS28]|uniref:Uncharacterized protein n=1 Tax=Mucilaginibacter straminoryzae TaxID=2932774 RepID=A0A9X1X154_9SPHI|nr:hypothetical protein [Mucilaginibacter straminoryzae]MCJ8208105.1 hypothetical protein [Mucilaginibacter straminoryzae]
MMKKAPTQARELPRFTIEGTEFIVDIQLNELRQADAPGNRISMDELLWETDGKLAIVYDTATRNIANMIVDPEDLPPDIRIISMPPLLSLDPVGWARKFGLADDTFIKSQPPAADEAHEVKPEEQKKEPPHKKRKGKGI